MNQSDDTIGWRREAFDDLSMQIKQNANLLPLADAFGTRKPRRGEDTL